MDLLYLKMHQVLPNNFSSINNKLERRKIVTSLSRWAMPYLRSPSY